MKLYHLIMIVFILTLTVNCTAPTPAPGLTPAPTPAPAVFSLSNLTIQPADVQPGGTVTITIDLTNTGGTAERYTATLMINGIKEGEKSITVAAGDTKTVAFSVIRRNPASYNVVVDGLSGSFTVVTPTPIPTPTPQAPITVLSDMTLTADLAVGGNGIIIGADNIVLDLGGHTIIGPGKGPWIWPDPALSSVGIELTGRKGITIRNGQIEDFATGILIEDSQSIIVQDITTSLNHYGIYLLNSGNNTLKENNITSNTYGLHLMYSNENRITKNWMFDNHYNSPGGYGICLIASSKNIITENTIELNANQGIWFIKAIDNLVYHNNIMGNSPNALDQSWGNLYYNPDLRQGNYWGDYSGKDSNGYGIGDTPYPFLYEGEDPYPFIKRDGWRDKAQR